MRPEINAPSGEKSGMPLISECRFALEPSLAGLLDAAEAAGWARSTTVTALATLLVDFTQENPLTAQRMVQRAFTPGWDTQH